MTMVEQSVNATPVEISGDAENDTLIEISKNAENDTPIELNSSLTGYFNDGVKKIDIVLVIKDDYSDDINKTQINFLLNVIQFGLEAEIEPGKMFDHHNLLFVKLHAPDAIIEEFGIYFNEKSLFKDSHLEFVKPFVNVLGTANERELIKIVRKQYPGPDNYSTLERSKIVYKILLQLPFGQYGNHFGINRLIDNNIIEDAFALHDGPYLFLSQQRPVDVNARQVLYFEWLGILNAWKLQPIHMIHEYFGKRISYYFTFYEYFNFMLIIPCIFGSLTVFLIEINEYEGQGPYNNMIYEPCYVSDWKKFVYPECRNYSLCPMIKYSAYCQELRLLAKIDTDLTPTFGVFIVFWGLCFLLPWRYLEKYLTWIWEESKRHTSDLVRPEYEKYIMKSKKEKNAKNIRTEIGLIIERLYRVFIYMCTAICLSLWVLVVFRFSLLIWHYPRWRRLHAHNSLYAFKNNENENLAVGAGIYTIIVYFLKMVLIILAQKVTNCENNKTFLIYERSIAFKIYAVSFIGSFLILIAYSYLGSIILFIKEHKLHKIYYYLYGYGLMNSGLGSALDDISITLAVMTILEHVLFRIPGFIIKGKTDHPTNFNRRVPCWEREYKLKPITEFFFHKQYLALAMQFALVTCYSMTFPLAPLFLFITNIWDLRHTARQLLLEYRRPLLTNKSGPGFWKFLIFITAFYAPMSNTAIILFQSRAFAKKNFVTNGHDYITEVREHRKTVLQVLPDSITGYNNMLDKVYEYYGLGEQITLRRLADSQPNLVPPVQLELFIRYMVLTTIFGAVLGFFLFYVIPETSNALEEAIKKEQRIKYKYQIRWTLLNK